LFLFSQFPTTVRATSLPHRHWNDKLIWRSDWRISAQKWTLACFAPRRFRICLGWTLGKRRRRASALQLLDLGTQLLNHLLLFQNDPDQILTTEGVE
jgi:hypothetical protein